VVESAIARAETHWENRRSEQYNDALQRIQRQHNEVVQVADDGREKIKELTLALEDGLLSPQEARAQVRTFAGYHADLLAQHRGVAESDTTLSEFMQQDIADFAEEQMERFPSVGQNARPLAYYVNQVIGDQQTAHHRQTNPEAGAAVDASMIRHPDGPQ
jgi:hypothetical protein